MLTAGLLEGASERVDDTLTLPFETRQKSRFKALLDSGKEVVVRLPRGTHLVDGALLSASDGGVIRISAALEEVSTVRSEDALLLTRAAYHLGNRHVPLQVEAGSLSYLHDHVLDDMLRKLGLEPAFAERPFEPERGAYGHASPAGGHGHAASRGGHGHAGVGGRHEH